MQTQPIQMSLPFIPQKTVARSIYEQTGWVRPYPKMICQEIEILEALHEYDFDLSDEDFLAYLKSRTGIMPFACCNRELKNFFLTDNGAEQWILESPEYKFLDGTMVPFGKDREVKVRIIKIQKGKIQDCWELFNQL